MQKTLVVHLEIILDEDEYSMLMNPQSTRTIHDLIVSDSCLNEGANFCCTTVLAKVKS